MITDIITFVVALAVLIVASNYFTDAASKIGNYLKLPAFVVGVFIVGIGTSLPELVSGVMSVVHGKSEILAGNIIGANISNLLLVTGLAVVLNRKNIDLGYTYISTDLQFLIGSFFYFVLIAFDGVIEFFEAITGAIIFLIYSFHLLRNNKTTKVDAVDVDKHKFPLKALIILILSAAGVYFGADFTVSSLSHIAEALNIPNAIIALTLLSLGTTLPELTVNISAIRKGQSSMAVGNVLGSSVANTLLIPSLGSIFGVITVPENLLSFSLPVMVGAGLMFYLLTQDKKISVAEGYLFFVLYGLFLMKIIL
ncbi:MAG: sodium:calcium antiporter [Paludibacteraceae bacterium]